MKYESTEQDVRYAMETMTAENAGVVHRRLADALQLQFKLQREHERLVRWRLQYEAWAAQQEDFRAKLSDVSHRVATYTSLLAEEQASLNVLREEHAKFCTQLEDLGKDRELFKLWSSAFSGRKLAKPTFRALVLEARLGELNTLAAQIMELLYEDTRHANSMMTGMLQSIFSDDESADEDEHNDGKGSAILDSSLNVKSALAYGKRSGGERKRIDLALFFALSHMSQASTTHRAHYILVDEVFDSLDVAGRAAVVRWCDALATWMDFVLVITHNEHLVKDYGEEETSDEGLVGRRAVMSARIGNNGVEWEVGGRVVGCVE